MKSILDIIRFWSCERAASACVSMCVSIKRKLGNLFWWSHLHIHIHVHICLHFSTFNWHSRFGHNQYGFSMFKIFFPSMFDLSPSSVAVEFLPPAIKKTRLNPFGYKWLHLLWPNPMDLPFSGTKTLFGRHSGNADRFIYLPFLANQKKSEGKKSIPHKKFTKSVCITPAQRVYTLFFSLHFYHSLSLLELFTYISWLTPKRHSKEFAYIFFFGSAQRKIYMTTGIVAFSRWFCWSPFVVVARFVLTRNKLMSAFDYGRSIQARKKCRTQHQKNEKKMKRAMKRKKKWLENVNTSRINYTTVSVTFRRVENSHSKWWKKRIEKEVVHIYIDELATLTFSATRKKNWHMSMKIFVVYFTYTHVMGKEGEERQKKQKQQNVQQKQHLWMRTVCAATAAKLFAKKNIIVFRELSNRNHNFLPLRTTSPQHVNIRYVAATSVAYMQMHSKRACGCVFVDTLTRNVHVFLHVCDFLNFGLNHKRAVGRKRHS